MDSEERNAVLESIFGNDDDYNSLNNDVNDDRVTNGNVSVHSDSEGSIDETEAYVEHGPQPGMFFRTLESLFKAYKEHAKYKGFGVAKKSACKGRNGDRRYQTISCDKGRKTYYEKSSKRTNCPARLSAVLRSNGFWQVTKVQRSHNHDLEPSMCRFMTGHRNLDPKVRRNLEANDIAGIRPCKSIRLLEVQSGGPENLTCLPKDCRNFIEKKRRLRLGAGDAESIHQLFLRMQQRDRDFFHLIDVDSDGRLCNVIWVHPRAKAAYEEFNDVVTFDTTYLVNRYKMPFATFVGINHHGQSILLGCALISHENVDTFKWLFSCWLSAMGDIKPKAIMTDQCESIRKAISEVMTTTVHRFCLWHILCKVPEKFKSVADYGVAICEFKAVIYDSLIVEMFENNWNQFLEKHRLQENEWLSKLYRERENWVPIYLNNIFWAGMLSTQRSESMHAYFDGYVNSMSTLKQFVEQYEIAMLDKIEKELYLDFRCKDITIKCISDFEWERQFQQAFTHGMFKVVQAEIRRMLYCNVIPHTEEALQEDGVEIFKVTERCILNDWYRKEFTYEVVYVEDGQQMRCNCRKFESKGILCCHILKILSVKDINMINERYLIRRWRKDVYRRHNFMFFIGGYPHMTEEYEAYRKLDKKFQETYHCCIDNKNKLDYLNKRLEDLRTELLNWHDGMNLQDQNSDVIIVTQQDDENSQRNTIVLDPFVTRSRGRPRSNRFRSRREVRQNNDSRNHHVIRGIDGRGRARGRRQNGRGRSRNQISSNVPSQVT